MNGTDTENQIRILLNDEEMSIVANGTVDTLLHQLAMDEADRIAVAVNDTVVRRDDWAAHRLNDQDRVLLIAPIQGG